MKEEEVKLLLRELTMRGNYAFPENEQDEIWFSQGIAVSQSGDFMKRLFLALDLGEYLPTTYPSKK